MENGQDWMGWEKKKGMNLPRGVWLQQLDQSMVVLYMEMEKGWQKITCGVLLCWVEKGIPKKKSCSGREKGSSRQIL